MTESFVGVIVNDPVRSEVSEGRDSGAQVVHLLETDDVALTDVTTHVRVTLGVSRGTSWFVEPSFRF